MNLVSIIVHGLTAYILTVVVTESHVMKPARRLFRELAWEALPEKLGKMCVRWWATDELEEFPILSDVEDTDLTMEREIWGFDAISCALCVGFWISLVVCACAWLPLNEYLAVYAVTWVLHRQER